MWRFRMPRFVRSVLVTLSSLESLDREGSLIYPLFIPLHMTLRVLTAEVSQIK
jgi:hypothetical protein